MDYLGIILQGYFNENNRKYLEKYFFREFKKAEKKHFDADEFVSGCLNVFESWEKYIQNKIYKRKTELYTLLSAAQNGNLKLEDIEGKTIEQQRQEMIDYCKRELSDTRPDGVGDLTFTVNLSSLTNRRINYNMPYNELLDLQILFLRAARKIKRENANNVLLPKQTDLTSGHDTNEIKPILKPESLDTLFEIIKDFFSIEQQAELKLVFRTGNVVKQKLLFRDNGNRLTDTFKKLFEHNFITGCQKKDLIKWIFLNFKFRHNNQPKNFNEKTVEKSISGNNYHCKSPVIEIRNGQIHKVEKPRKRNQGYN